ncbi:hypothetical protein AX16_002312 [Volvariella volvacea WC 439]|nr:hypothetical protein AX16_002312 [Volvariella volvacea WC 439]
MATCTTHISRFPVEIFEQIFDAVIQFAIVTPRYGRGLKSYTYEYHLTLTGICGQWRQIAIAHAPLWTVIQLPHSNRTWISQLILRSKEHPLSVSWIPSLSTWRPLSQEQEDTLALVLPHMQRTVELDFFFYMWAGNKHSQALQLLSQSAPVLRRFYIQHLPSELPSLFENAAPVLHDLYIGSCTLPQGSLFPLSPPQQLTSLRLTATSIRLSPSEFIDAIRALPNLTQLIVERSIPWSWYYSGPGATPRSYCPTFTSLDTLTHLSIMDPNIEACAAFLDLIPINPEANIEISAGYAGIDQVDKIIPFCKRLGKTAVGEPVACVRDLSILDFRVMKTECGMVSTLDERYRPGGFKLKLEIDHVAQQDDRLYGGRLNESVFCLIANSLTSPTIRSSTLRLGELGESEWREIFAGMKNLEALTIVIPQDREYDLKELASALDIPHGSSDNSISLPQLKSFVISEHVPSEQFNALCDSLKRRKEIGYSLESLSFSNDYRHRRFEHRHYATRYEELGLEYPYPISNNAEYLTSFWPWFLSLLAVLYNQTTRTDLS